jgi:hypothetical protein
MRISLHRDCLLLALLCGLRSLRALKVLISSSRRSNSASPRLRGEVARPGVRHSPPHWRVITDPSEKKEFSFRPAFRDWPLKRSLSAQLYLRIRFNRLLILSPETPGSWCYLQARRVLPPLLSRPRCTLTHWLSEGPRISRSGTQVENVSGKPTSGLCKSRSTDWPRPRPGPRLPTRSRFGEPGRQNWLRFAYSRSIVLPRSPAPGFRGGT